MIERVIVIGLDGAGSFHSSHLTPNVVSFLESGTYSNSALNEFPTNSGENWGSLLTGVKPTKHGVNNTSILQPYSEESNFPTIFKLIGNAFPASDEDNILACFVAWGPIVIGLVEQSVPVTKVVLADEDIVKVITTEFLPEKGQKVKFLFIHLDGLDSAGHSYGWNSPEYEAQYVKTDGYVNEILEAIDKAGLRESTLVVLTADHGGLHKEHGGPSMAERHILWGMRGPGVLQKEIGPNILSIMDIPATLLNALGIHVPFNFDGQVVPLFNSIET